jgi:Cu+-exporting ATPase
MYSKILAAACSAFVLAGCAGGSGQPLPADDHPASPRAATSPLPAPSSTLAVARAAQTRPATEAAASEPAQQHSHDHGAPAPATAPADQAAAVYVCPHHPEVTSTNPNDRCPKCHMKLVPKEAQ